MTLFRSLTTRRTLSTKKSTVSLKISSPMKLLSTTNQLSYDAPNIYAKSVGSKPASLSGDESDGVPSLTHSAGNTSSDESSPSSHPTSPEPNHLSCYFNPRSSTSSAEDAPVIPKRSLSRMSSRASTQKKHSVSSFRQDSVTVFSPTIEVVTPVSEADTHHPFGSELAQVSELAEEFAGQCFTHTLLEEEQELLSRGFRKFDAQAYITEIEDLWASTFQSSPISASASTWI